MKTANTNQPHYIFLNKIVAETSSNTEGDRLYFALIQASTNNSIFVLVADRDHSFTSSFLNSSIGRFIDELGMDKFKNHFKFRGSKSQFERISNYLATYEEIFS